MWSSALFGYDVLMTSTIGDQALANVTTAVRRIVAETFPGVAFGSVHVRPRESAYGDVVLDIYAVYEGGVDQLQTAARPGFLPRVADALRDLHVDAVPVTRFIAQDDAEDWTPEGY